MLDRTLPRPIHKSTGAFLCAAICKCLYLCAIFALGAAVAPAQTQTPAQTPFLFTATPMTYNPDGSENQLGIVTLLRDPYSGVLTLLPAAPTILPHPCLPEVMEPQGQFLLGTCKDGLAMYSFNSTSGAVLEVLNAPWAETTTGYPFAVAPESTGQYVYLLKFYDPTPGGNATYILDTFLIDRTTPQLIPQSTQALPFGSKYEGAMVDPNGHGVAVVSVQENPNTGVTTITIYDITFDPLTGAATIPTTGTTLPGSVLYANAMSPQGRYLAFSSAITLDGTPYVSFLTMAPATFEISGPPTTILNTFENIPPFGTGFLSFDPLGGLMYDQIPPLTPPTSGDGYPFAVLQMPSLTYLDTVSWDQSSMVFGGVNDPDGPFTYQVAAGTPPQGVSVYEIDPGTGLPLQTGRPWPIPFIRPCFSNRSNANYAQAGSGQSLSGPFLSQSTGSLTFPQTIAGQNSSSQTVTLKSIGSQTVSVNQITLSGANISDFVISGNCLSVPVVLLPQSSCQLTITYAPAIAGTSQAALTITSTSPTSPQLIALSGTAGVPSTPAPSVAFNTPNPYSFPGTIAQGTSSAPQNIALTNSRQCGSTHRRRSVGRLQRRGFFHRRFQLHRHDRAQLQLHHCADIFPLGRGAALLHHHWSRMMHRIRLKVLTSTEPPHRRPPSTRQPVAAPLLPLPPEPRRLLA